MKRQILSSILIFVGFAATAQVQWVTTTKTGSHTLEKADAGKRIRMNCASPCNFTIPGSGTHTFAINTYFSIEQVDAAVTIVESGGASVILPSGYSLETAGAGLIATFVYNGSNSFTSAGLLCSGCGGGGGAVDDVFGRTGSVVAVSGDYTGTQITNTPAGDIAATTTQGAVDELDSEKEPLLTFTAADFNESGQTISIDYTNGTAAATGAKGFLTATDWNTFNGKQTALSGTGLLSFSGTTPSYNTTSSSIAGIISDEVGSGPLAFVRMALNTQTTSYTLAASDEFKEVQMNAAGATNITLPPDATTPVGFRCSFRRIGAGAVTFLNGSGVTSTFSSGQAVDAGQYNLVDIFKDAANHYEVTNGQTAINGTALTASNGYMTVTLGGTPATALVAAASVAVTMTGIPSVANGDMIYASGTNTFTNKNIFNTTQTALLHLKAGTATASTAPLKFTTGTLLTTIESGAVEFNGSHYRTNTALNRIGIGGVIADFVADVANSGTSETDIQTYTTKASTLSATGEKLTARYSGTFTDATATAQMKVLFGGTNIFDSGALTLTGTGSWDITVLIIRTGASTARSIVTMTTGAAAITSYTTETDVTGLTFTNTNILKTTATAGGGGGGSSDIIGKLGSISWAPAAAN